MIRRIIGLVILIVALFSVSVFAGDGIVGAVQGAINYLNKPSDKLTQDENAFLQEMAQIKSKLLNLDELKNKKDRLDYEKVKLEGWIAQLERKIANSKTQDIETLEKELTQEQGKLSIIAQVESVYSQLMPILQSTYTICVQLEGLSKNLTKENIKSIRILRENYEAGNYPQQLLKILGLDQVISIKTGRKVQTAWEGNFIQRIFVKAAYAETDPTGGAGVIVDIACPPVGAYDAAVGWAGAGLDIATWAVTLGCYDGNCCSEVASWIQVDSNVNRVVNACGLSDANHVVEKTIEAGLNKLFSCGCSESEGKRMICGKCCEIEDKECICEACDSGEWNGKDCDCKKGYEKVGDDCCVSTDEHCKCNAKGKVWNWERKVCCDKGDELCLCYGEVDEKLGCCEGGHWDNGLCCKKYTYNSNGHCCPSGDDWTAGGSVSFVWDGKECACPQGTKKIRTVCCKEGDEKCECEANLDVWDHRKNKCCKREDEKCQCLLYEFDWNDELKCCKKGKWSDGLCCRLDEYNSNGHCCREGEEWSEHSSGFWPFNSTDGKCCPTGTFYDGEECVCAKGEEKTNGHCCPIGHIWLED